MGYLTTITIKNDRLHEFKSNPLQFAKDVFEGIERANRDQKQADLRGNSINVEPSRHADEHTVYLHSGNGVFNLYPFNNDFKDLAARNSDVLKEFLKRAQNIITLAKKEFIKLSKV